MYAVPSIKSGWLHRRLSQFEQPRVRRLAIGLAVLLLTPTLVSGLALDDYKLVDQMNERDVDHWPGSAPFDLFRWMDPEHNHHFMDGLGFPWWTLESAKVAFMRPVSSLTHTVDHWLWPSDPFWMHAQSLLWFALLLLLAGVAYAELIESRWVAGVACALFAFDDAHGVPAGWLCNRNALLAGVFGLAALVLHHRARVRRSAALGAGAAICFGLCLLSGELGVGMLGYLVAYALCFEAGPAWARIRSIVPYVLVLFGWGALRSALGYGSYGVDFYLDPIHEPAAFLGKLPERWAQLVTSQSSGVPSDIWGMLTPELRAPLLALGVLGAAAMLWFLEPTLRADRRARFWALGAGLSAVPITAALPSDRLLVLVGIGVMAVLAQAFNDVLLRAARVHEHAGAHAASRIRGSLAGALIAFRLGLAPLLLPLAALSPAALDSSAHQIDASLPTDASVRGQTVIVTDVPDPLMLSYLPLRREFLREARPAQLYWLAAAPTTLRLERRAPNVLRVSANAGLFSSELEQSARTARQPFKRGDRVVLSQMTIDVIALTPDGRPAVCDFTFAHPLESPTYLWKRWRAGQLVNFRVPRIGEIVETTADEPRS